MYYIHPVTFDAFISTFLGWEASPHRLTRFHIRQTYVWSLPTENSLNTAHVKTFLFTLNLLIFCWKIWKGHEQSMSYRKVYRNAPRELQRFSNGFVARCRFYIEQVRTKPKITPCYTCNRVSEGLHWTSSTNWSKTTSYSILYDILQDYTLNEYEQTQSNFLCHM